MRGITLSNGPLEADDLQRLLALKATDVIDFQLFKERWPLVKQALGAKLHIRIVTGGYPIAANDAADLAAHSTPLCTSIRIRNELDIEGAGITPKGLYDYLIELAPLVRDLPVNVAAVSPNSDAYIEANCAGCRDGRHRGLDVHAYGSPTEFACTLGKYRALYSGPILVTEYNFGAGREYDLTKYANDWPTILDIARQHDVSAVCAFIWRWHNPDTELKTTVDVKGTQFEITFPLAGDVVGEGFKKVEHLVGPWLEGQVYHWPGSSHEVSMAVGQHGVAVWYKLRNETYAMLATGEVYADMGNYGDSYLKRIR